MGLIYNGHSNRKITLTLIYQGLQIFFLSSSYPEVILYLEGNRFTITALTSFEGDVCGVRCHLDKSKKYT